MLMSRTANGHPAYDAVRFVSLFFLYPNLPFRTVRSSVRCDSVTLPSEWEGPKKIFLPGPEPAVGGLTYGNKS